MQDDSSTNIVVDIIIIIISHSNATGYITLIGELRRQRICILMMGTEADDEPKWVVDLQASYTRLDV